MSEAAFWGALMLAAVALLLSALASSWRDRPQSKFWATIGAAMVLIAFTILMVDDITASDAVPAPAPSPSVMMDPLQECYALGGVQMVLADGAWKCVTADQAG